MKKIAIIILVLVLNLNLYAGSPRPFKYALGLLMWFNVTHEQDNCHDGPGVCMLILGYNNEDGEDVLIDNKSKEGFFTIDKKTKGIEEYVYDNKFHLKIDSPFRPDVLKSCSGITDNYYQIPKGSYKIEDIGKKYKVFFHITKIQP